MRHRGQRFRRQPPQHNRIDEVHRQGDDLPAISGAASRKRFVDSQRRGWRTVAGTVYALPGHRRDQTATGRSAASKTSGDAASQVLFAQ